jgi:hypothetical protein
VWGCLCSGDVWKRGFAKTGDAVQVPGCVAVWLGGCVVGWLGGRVVGCAGGAWGWVERRVDEGERERNE